MLIFDQLRKGDRDLQLLAVGVLGGMGILLASLWYLQVISAKRYRADLQGQSFRAVRVPATRGKILDRNGHALADNRPCYNVNLYLEELRRDFFFHYTNRVKPGFVQANPKTKLTRAVTDELQRQARHQVVSNYLAHVSGVIQQPRFLLEKEFHRHYDQKRSLPLPLLTDLSFQQVAMFAEKAPNLSSLALEAQPLRVYRHKSASHASAAAHLVGHLEKYDSTNDNELATQFRLLRLPDYRGSKGIEKAFDSELRGKPGIKLVLVNSMQYRQSEEMWIEPEPGQNVVLTIDLAIQQAAERALAAYRDGASTRGAVVVMDANNGDILAAASSPAIDSNEFMSSLSPDRWAAMKDENLLPLFNRALYGTYQPGSTFKIITGLACLEAGLNPDETFQSKGYFQLRPRGRQWRDTAGEGAFNFRRAFCYSSNPYFQSNGVFRAGPQRIMEMGQRFGLGEPTGVTKNLEAKGYYPNHEDLRKKDGGRWMPGDTANLCIGQGELTVTPLQMAVLTAAVANGGKLWQPRLVARVERQESDSKHPVVEYPAGQLRGAALVNPQHLALVRQAMLDDVEYRDPLPPYRRATGYKAFVKGMRVCGKTGTAQVFDEHGQLKEYTTWFVSFAPFESPRYVVVVVIEGGGSGGGDCCPIAEVVYQALLKIDAAG